MFVEPLSSVRFRLFNKALRRWAVLDYVIMIFPGLFEYLGILWGWLRGPDIRIIRIRFSSVIVLTANVILILIVESSPVFILTANVILILIVESSPVFVLTANVILRF